MKNESLGDEPTPKNNEIALEVEHLTVSFEKSVVVNDMSFSVRVGEVVTILGPSGCGKSTTLRVIAGLKTPVSGRIRIFGRTVFDSDTGIDVPTEQRGLGMVFQNYAIWPHLTVFENVAYGLRVRGVRGSELRERVRSALETVGLADFADRPAPDLSGGQQQRVALARSFVFGPKLVLLDEPLSNLDTKLRAQLRVEIAELQKQLLLTTLFVTHDLAEALTISDQIVVMLDGQVQQIGDPLTLFHRPKNEFTAEFVGASNLLPVTRTKPGGTGDLISVELANGACVQLAVSNSGAQPNTIAVKGIHAELSRAEGALSTPNHWLVTVQRAVFSGDLVEYYLDWQGIEFIARLLPATPFFRPGEQLTLSLDPSKLIGLTENADG